MDIWKDLANLEIDLPDNGEGPPIMEEEEEVPKVVGILWEVTTKIYIWSDLDNHKYQITSTQDMVALGECTLEDAKKRQRRNRRKGA